MSHPSRAVAIHQAYLRLCDADPSFEGKVQALAAAGVSLDDIIGDMHVPGEDELVQPTLKKNSVAAMWERAVSRVNARINPSPAAPSADAKASWDGVHKRLGLK